MYDWTRVNCDHDRWDSSGTRRENAENSVRQIIRVWTNFFDNSDFSRKTVIHIFYTHFLFISFFLFFFFLNDVHERACYTYNFGGIRLG